MFFLPLRDTGAIRRLVRQRLHYDKGTGLSSGRRCSARELLDGSTARERGTWIHGVYILGRVYAGCRAAHLPTHSHLETAWPAGTGWCGQLGQVGAASRTGLVWPVIQSLQVLTALRFSRVTSGVTSVLPVVTSGYDVRLWRPQERPSWDGRGITGFSLFYDNSWLDWS
jgi:hypothetical protein